MIGIARRPRLACHNVSLLAVRRIVTRRESILHRQTVEERFDGRTHLSATQAHHVVHEMRIVQASHISLDGTRLWIHAHKTTPQEFLVITDRIERTHQRVDVTVISKHGHLYLLPERLVDFTWRIACRLHCAPSLTLGDGAIQDGTYLLRCQLIREWRARLRFVLLVESRLQVSSHMLIDSLLGISLHTTVDGREHLQAIGIYIVRTSILLKVLVTPAIQWV